MQSSGVESSTLFLTHPSSRFTQGSVLYTFQPRIIGQNSVFGIEFQETCPNDTFSMDQSTGMLSVIRTIDYNQVQGSLEPVCVRGRNSDYFTALQTFYCFVTIDGRVGMPVVIDVIPELSSAELMFPQTFYSSHVVEGVVNATVTIAGPLQAISQPLTDAIVPNYRIIGEHSSDFTVIQTSTNCQSVPAVVTSRPLCRLLQSYYNLTLEAYTSTLSATTTIGVQLLDINNESPQFVSVPDSESLTLPEDTPIGVEFGRFTAIDMDVGLNSEVRYSIPDSLSLFSIHPLSGALFLFSPISTLQPSAQLTISATDLGNPTRSNDTNVIVSIESSNVFPPVIVIHSLGPVAELAPQGLVVGTIEVIHSSSSPVSVTLVNNGPCECFRLSDATTAVNGSLIYDVEVNGAIDFETTPNGIHIFTLNATDALFSTVEQEAIEITNVNEEPNFAESAYTVEVFEGIPVGSEIAHITASDPDQGVLSYSISGTDSNRGLLAIHSMSGTIYTTGELDYENVSSIQITLMAQDSGQEEAMATVTVNILDRNDNIPVFISAMNSTVTIPETQGVNQEIFHFTVSDVDGGCNGAVEYSIIHAEPQVFRIDSYSGLLFPMNESALDYETFQSARVVVRATDLGSDSRYSIEANLFILLTDADDEAPVIDPIDCPCFIREDVSTNANCFPLSAQDKDSTSVQFSIATGDDSGLFRIDPTSGIVSTTRALNREQYDTFMLNIVASDSTQTSQPETLTIIIVDANEPPRYPSTPISITIPQNLNIGDFVGNVAAMDADVGFNSVTLYEFQTGTNPTFHLDRLSGNLIVRNPLSPMTYSFVVVARDITDSASSASVTVTINVSGQKNNPPSFVTSIDRRIVPADLPLNSFIAQLNATDGDSGVNGQLTYSIVAGNHSGLFSVNSSGAVIAAQSLSSSASNVYVMNISATDSGFPQLSAYQDFIIEVYPTTTTVAGVPLVHNPAVNEICHFKNSVIEMTDASFEIASLPSVGSQTTTYTVLPSNVSNAFQISIFSQTESVLRVRTGFVTVFTNRELILLTLRAQYGNNFHLCSVTIVITDINNNPALFVSDSFSIDVYSGTPPGSAIYQLEAVDADIGTNAQMQFSLPSSSGLPFTLDRDSGVLTLSSSLDQSSYMFSATVTDSTYLPRQTSTATVQVTVLQTTNNQPVLSTVPPLNITETTSVGHVIVMLSAMDTDTGVHGANRFCILSGNEYNVFRVTRSGQLLVHRELDYESYPHHYDLIVRAYDSSNNPQYVDTSVSIDITDENDEAPVFSTTIYTATVMENQMPGLHVITVSAVDRDDGTNGEVRYSLSGTSPFSIDAESGMIRTTSAVDREVASTYTVTVIATDQSAIQSQRLSSSAELRVVVLDENDENPEFSTPSNTRHNVREDTSVGSEIIQLLASDGDDGANAELKYSIVSGNDDFTFSLDPWTGSLSLARSLDFESTTRAYVLRFQVTDLGAPPRSAVSTLQLFFDVTDVNDNYPVFSSDIYECSFVESEGMSAAFDSNCQVGATDADEASSTTTYSITNPPAGLPFGINSQTGVLSIVGLADAEVFSRYIIRVQATDSGAPSLSTTALVVVTVRDANDNVAVFGDPISSLYIPELTPDNSLLFFAHAFDRDLTAENSNTSYQIFVGSGFRIHPTSGAVFLDGTLNSEELDMHQLTVLGVDPATGSSSQKTFNIQVVDINENLLPPTFPVGRNPSVVVTSRAAAPGTLTATITAIDTEGGTISYHIIGGTGYGYFHVGTSNGSVTISYPLISVEDDDLSLIIRADDGGRFPLTSEFRLTVVLGPDENAKPLFVAPVFYANPSESTAPEEIFTHVRAEVNGYADPSVCYSIAGGNEAGMFAIDTSTGAVYKTLVGNLDREIVSTYSLTVNASKPGIAGISTALLIIELADANDFRPRFVSTDFNVSVFETFNPAEPFVRVFAVDNDAGENGRLSYSIQSTEMVPFEISETTGYVHLTSPLNRSSVSYTVTVVASDHGDPALDGMTTLTVNVISPAPSGAPIPFFMQIPQQVFSEGTVPGTSLITFTPQNPSNTLLYRFVENTDQFAISPNSGEVFLTRSLDHEAQSSASYTIAVTDGTNIVTVVLPILVSEVNEYRPQFTQGEFQIPVMENFMNNQTFGSITATDPEDAIVYSLVDSQDPRSLSLFDVSSDGSVRTLFSGIDREEIPVHILTVEARDFGDPPLLNYARLIINIIDINDNSPTYEDTEVFIPENTPVSTSIFTVAAFDPDQGENAQVLYSLVSTNPLFLVNATSGDIILTSSLDAETQQQHTLVISAANPDGLQTSQVNIVVNVIDVLDSTPVLLNPGTVTVQENLPMYTFVTSLADTSSISRPVFYSIVDGNVMGHFFVEPLTGILRTTTLLNREAVPSYQLTVQGAFEDGFETNVSFTVTVGDVNDQTPQFPSAYLSNSIPENASLNVPLIDLNVIDLDEDSNALYVISDGVAANFFSVSASGYLMLTQNLDRESQFTSITFEIYVIDTDYPNSYSSALMHIEVIDSNDNPPQFQYSEYTFTISTPTLLNLPFPRVKVTATDPDLGVYGEVQYEISERNGMSKFGINRVTGEITVINNYQLQPQYSLTVSATDGGGQRSSVQVTIFIEACGFQNLLFLPASFVVDINENVALDTDVITPNDVNVLQFNEPAQLMFSLPIFNPIFGVDPQTGRIFTDGEIDREENDAHYLVLQAVDMLNPQRLAQAEIEVRVLDMNDNSPMFQTQNYVASILNTATPGTEVIRVSALDDDIGINSDLVYSLIVDSASTPFRIDPDSGAIFVNSTLNTAQLGTSVVLTAVATDQGNSPRSAQVDVVIDIVDSNAPRFTQSVYREEVSEAIGVGSPIVTVAVNVSSNNPSITFRLDTDDLLLPLSLGFFDGVVTVVDPGFDYESVQSYTVSILAEDSTTSLTGQARLEIIILDENDNTPIFDAPGSFYTVSVAENVDTGTVIIQVSASDIDSPINAQITYRFNPDSPFLNTFSVDSSNGVIRTIGNIDYEEYPVYELEIIAEDSGVPQRTGLATVRIITNNLNDNPPMFTESVYQDSAPETARVGTGLLFVTATDPDRLNSITYAIVPVGVGHEKFAINSNGLISIHQSLSGSSVFTYTLNISAFDGELYGYARVVIEVENTNDNSPMFNQSIYTGSVVEGSPSGRYVTQVFATDNDRGNNAEITYSVSSTSLFTIDSQLGIITTAAGGSTIDRELTPSFQFSVVARDGGGRIGTARVDVTITDVNDNAPQFLQTSYNSSIIESAPTGTPVLSLDVSDSDVGENARLIFRVFPINVESNQFPFSIDNNGLVRVSIGLRFDVVSFYSFVVSVRDNGTVPLSARENATVTIHIQDDISNNPPRFLEDSYVFSVPETSRQGDSVGVIEVDDTTRMNCIISYNPVEILDYMFFNVVVDTVTDSGTVSLANSLTTGDYNLVVEAVCRDPFMFEIVSRNIISITVQVYDVNSNPTFNNFVYSGMISENSSISTTVSLIGFSPISGMPPSSRDITAEDGDNGANGTVTYSIADREALMIPFDIGPTDGILRVSEELDFETDSDYTIAVIAMDGGTPPLSAITSVTIAVLDVNDSPPEFERDIYRIDIPENTPINTTVRTVQALDNDTSAANTIIYRLSGEVFTIDETTGEITIAQSLDREVQPVHTLLVLVTDGLFSDNAAVVISVTDVNDNRPIFNESLPALSLVENYPVGETIVRVFATDADEDENADITYSIAEQPDNGEVTVDPSSGEVSFLVSPDFEMSPRIEFQVAATDIGGLQDFTTIAINLLDLNDNKPTFTSPSYSASVTEHSAAVSNVVRVEAIDADSGVNGTVIYRIEGNANSDFTISSTGVILTQRSFDREVDPFFDFIVTASDQFNLSSNATVHVSVADINDQQPTFPQSEYQVSVSEDEEANFVILTTAATDGDVESNARIRYALSGENHNEFRLVAQSNGSVSIVLANELNRERLDNYTLMLRAIDEGIPQMDSTAIVRVAVLDVNDNCPEFREPRYSETIPENITVSTTILSVEAFDRDTVSQTQLVYSIREAGQASEISIAPDTGDISIASTLDFETRPVYTLMVEVSDGDENCQPTPAIVNITLSNVNDIPPHFFQHEETYSINENNFPGVLATFRADDQDSLGGKITFGIESGDVDDAFTINRVSGDLSVRRSLDREQTSMYNLVIAAADNDSPNLTATTNVTIVVNDLNDNAPAGGRQDIYIYLRNGTAPLVTLGQVYVNDSDIVNDHSFMIQNTNGALEINANDGSIRIGTTTPELGTHLFQVMITDADNTPALTNITARIQSISESTLENSFVMQFESITPQAFTDLILAKFLSRVAAVVSSTLQTDSDIEIQVFSIQASSVQPTNVDIIVAAQNLSTGAYMHPELIQHIIQINEEGLENYLGANIHTELVDLCRDSTCDPGEVCSNTYRYSSSNSMAFGTRSVTYLGLTSDHSTTCSEILPSPCDVIACPEPSYCVAEQEVAVCYDDCSTEPCLNGGTCIAQNPGYYCSCPDGYDGRNCEQTSATFTERTYAVFPMSDSHLEGSFSIDFITATRNGLLAFVGRYDNDFSDFISIELIDGRPVLSVSYGSDSRLLSLEVVLNDQQWHTISVHYNSTVSTTRNIPA